ncbi:MAG: DEAD/DEAH box helicase [Nanoarchaeota archaeon]
MITKKTEPNSEEEIFNVMHPLVKQWFKQKFQKFTPPQLYGLLEIHSRNNILVSASTGSGKSLTCFLSILNELVDSSEKGILEDRTYCVYISPLKALSNDIEVNLKEPLKEMEEIYGKKLGIRIGVRTGDTTTAERAKMAAKPPHILITTPESLGILLNTIKFKEHLRKVDWIAVDELHSLAENKRGVHLSLTLERLQQLSPGACRIGLSATVAPLETVAMYLVGNKDCIIVDAPFLKELDLKVISPVKDLIETTYDSMNKQTYELLDQLIQEHKTTIIFTNTRAGTERVVNHLKTKFPKNYSENIGAHHGSLSREHRLDLEQKMREGKLKVCVTSTSLELGIDIGYIDLVILLGSPKSVARAKQRCLPYDSRILLSDGTYKTIGEIVEHKLDVPIQSYDIKRKNFVKNKIIDYHKSISRQILNIKLHSGSLLRCTYEHPIMTQTGWKNASQLTEGEYVAEIFDLKNKSTLYLYEIIPKHKFYVENQDDFLRKIVDRYVQKKRCDYSGIAKRVGIHQNTLQNYMRKKGRRKSIRLDTFLKLMKICNVQKKQYLFYLQEIKSKSHHRKPLPLKFTKDLMWLAGVVASDGALTKSAYSSDIKIKIGNKDKRLLERCRRIYNEIGFYPKIRYDKKRKFYSLDCGAQFVVAIFSALGIKIGKGKSHNIEVSNILNKLPKDLIIPFIEGVLEGDGNKDINIRIFSSSKKFMLGIHNLLNRCGIHNYFVYQQAKTSKVIKKITSDEGYCLKIGRNKHVQEFLKYCTLYGKKAQFLKNKHYNKGPNEKDVDANISWTKILTITKENKKQQVYNITLKSEPNNYYAESLLMHNCGRAGHKLHDTIKGRIIVLDRDDLIENAVLSKHVVEHNIDRIHIPTNCLDVLAQQIYGIAISEQINIKELYALIKNSYCYQTLKWEEFLEVIDYLSGKYSTLEERHIYAKIWYDEETGMIGKRGKLARIIYMTNIGTIPDESFISVKIGDYIIGKIDENFLEKLKPGDIFVLGGNTYQFKHAKGMVAYVSTAIGRTPTVPSWVSDMLPLSFDLAMGIQKFRKLMEEKLKKYDKEEVLKFIQEYLYVDLNTAEAIFNYFYEQYKYLEIPHEKKILMEHYDEDKKKYVVFHALYGRKVNEVLSRAVAYAVSKTEKKDLEIGVNDNGFYLSFDKRINVTGVLNKIKSKDMDKIMALAIDKTEIIKRRFRHCATRALMILRTYKGQTKRVGRQQVSSMILLSAVRKISENFPILKETRREILEDLMDIENAKNVMKEIEDGKITIKEVHTNIPSPFAFNLVLQGKMDIMKADDKIEFLKRIHKDVMLKIKMKGG